MSSTDIEQQISPAELAELEAAEAELSAAVKGKVDRSKLQLPAIKVVNGLSKEADSVKLGTLINSLTAEEYGSDLEVVISDFYYGRFYAQKGGGKAYTARGEVAPENWPEEYAGERFTELDDGAEQWKLAVDADEHSWGSGPPIQTTINFVVTTAENPGYPLRLSMKSSDTPTANKILQMIDMAPTPWSYVFKISADGRPTPNGSSTYYGFKAEQVGTATIEQRQAAIKIATVFRDAEKAGDIEEVGQDDADAKSQAKAARQKKAAAKAGDGLGV